MLHLVWDIHLPKGRLDGGDLVFYSFTLCAASRYVDLLRSGSAEVFGWRSALRAEAIYMKPRLAFGVRHLTPCWNEGKYKLRSLFGSI